MEDDVFDTDEEVGECSGLETNVTNPAAVGENSDNVNVDYIDVNDLIFLFDGNVRPPEDY